MGDNIPGTNGLSQEKERDFNLTVQMPADLKCIGGELPRPASEAVDKILTAFA